MRQAGLTKGAQDGVVLRPEGDVAPASPLPASCWEACGHVETPLPSHQEKPPLFKILGHGVLYYS